MIRIFALFVTLVFLLGTPFFAEHALARGCGQESDCKIKNGTYRYATPEGWNGIDPIGVIVYLHGWLQTADDVMDYDKLLDLANDLHVSVVAPEGKKGFWSIPGAMQIGQRDDVSFVGEVLKDAAKRFALDEDKVILVGFSLGASLVWYEACSGAETYAGYVAIAGSFWRPYPESCDKPDKPFFHFHGEGDETIPFDGKMVNSASLQGGVMESFAKLGEGANCTPMQKPVTKPDHLMCEMSICRKEGAKMSSMQLCMHQNGHLLRTDWIKLAWRSIFPPE